MTYDKIYDEYIHIDRINMCIQTAKSWLYSSAIKNFLRLTNANEMKGKKSSDSKASKLNEEKVKEASKMIL